MTIVVERLEEQKVPFQGKVLNYTIEAKMTFRCECLSKQLLHGISNFHRSKRSVPDHSYCTFLQITGRIYSIYILLIINLLGYGSPTSEDAFFRELSQLCEKHGLLYSNVQRLTPRPSPTSSRKSVTIREFTLIITKNSFSRIQFTSKERTAQRLFD